MSYYANQDWSSGNVRIQVGSPSVHGERGPQLGPYDSADAAANAAIDEGWNGTLVFGPGQHIFSAGPVTIDRTLGVRVEAGAILNPTHSESVGLFNVTADDVRIEGPGRVVIDTWVNSQSVIKCSGAQPVIRDLNVDVTTTDGNESTVMVIFEFADGTMSGDIIGNTILPNRGVTCIKVTGVNKQRILDNRFVNDSVKGFGGTYNTHTTIGSASDIRRCYRVMDITDPEWIQISRNFIWGLGLLTVELDECIIITTADNAREHGHVYITENFIETVSCNRYVHLKGVEWGQITNNFFGTALGAAGGNATDSAIVLDSSDGTDDGQWCFNITIEANQIHNFALALGQGIYLNRVIGCHIRGLTATDWNADYVILVNPAGVRNVTIDGIDAQSSWAAANATHAIRLASGTWTTDSRMFVGRVTLSRGIDPSDGELGASAGTWTGVLSDASTGASGKVFYGFTNTTTLTDNGGGTSGGDTIALISDVATTQDAVATLAAKINTMIGLLDDLNERTQKSLH